MLPSRHAMSASHLNPIEIQDRILMQAKKLAEESLLSLSTEAAPSQDLLTFCDFIALLINTDQSAIWSEVARAINAHLDQLGIAKDTARSELQLTLDTWGHAKGELLDKLSSIADADHSIQYSHILSAAKSLRTNIELPLSMVAAAETSAHSSSIPTAETVYTMPADEAGDFAPRQISTHELEITPQPAGIATAEHEDAPAAAERLPASRTAGHALISTRSSTGIATAETELSQAEGGSQPAALSLDIEISEFHPEDSAMPSAPQPAASITTVFKPVESDTAAPQAPAPSTSLFSPVRSLASDIRLALESMLSFTDAIETLEKKRPLAMAQIPKVYDTYLVSLRSANVFNRLDAAKLVQQLLRAFIVLLHHKPARNALEAKDLISASTGSSPPLGESIIAIKSLVDDAELLGKTTGHLLGVEHTTPPSPILGAGYAEICEKHAKLNDSLKAVLIESQHEMSALNQRIDKLRALIAAKAEDSVLKERLKSLHRNISALSQLKDHYIALSNALLESNKDLFNIIAEEKEALFTKERTHPARYYHIIEGFLNAIALIKSKKIKDSSAQQLREALRMLPTLQPNMLLEPRFRAECTEPKAIDALLAGLQTQALEHIHSAKLFYDARDKAWHIPVAEGNPDLMAYNSMLRDQHLKLQAAITHTFSAIQEIARLAEREADPEDLVAPRPSSIALSRLSRSESRYSEAAPCVDADIAEALPTTTRPTVPSAQRRSLPPLPSEVSHRASSSASSATVFSAVATPAEPKHRPLPSLPAASHAASNSAVTATVLETRGALTSRPLPPSPSR